MRWLKLGAIHAAALTFGGDSGATSNPAINGIVDRCRGLCCHGALTFTHPEADCHGRCEPSPRGDADEQFVEQHAESIYVYLDGKFRRFPLFGAHI